MKGMPIHYIFFLLGLGTLSVYGQEQRAVLPPLQFVLPPLQFQKNPFQHSPPADRSVFPQTFPQTILQTTPQTISVRSMPPDKMPCRLPDLARVEQMPVRLMKNADPMCKPARKK